MSERSRQRRNRASWTGTQLDPESSHRPYAVPWHVSMYGPHDGGSNFAATAVVTGVQAVTVGAVISIDAESLNGTLPVDVQSPSHVGAAWTPVYTEPGALPGQLDELAVTPPGSTHAGALQVHASQTPGAIRSAYPVR